MCALRKVGAVLITENVKARPPSWAHNVAKRRGANIAVVALARRLAGILWAMWRDGSVYDPAGVAVATANGLRGAAQSTEFQSSR